MPTKDLLFRNPRKVSPFTFNRTVANVFDDMVVRSVPFYSELQRMMGELAATLYHPGTYVYDLGCSTGTTLISLMHSIRDPRARFVGFDHSAPMLEKARNNLAKFRQRRRVTFVLGDLNKPATFSLSRASVITANWTLQFVRPTCRQALLEKIHHALVGGGAFILSEKILAEREELNRLYTGFYYDFKRRQGYSELEIAQKREALDNVLMPCTITENLDLLGNAGFTRVDTFFRWYNWAAFLAVKDRSRP